MNQFNRTALMAGVLAIALLLAGAASASAVDQLPEEIQKELYDPDMIDPNQPVGESVYRDWKAPNPPPWTIGFAQSYAGNTWRAAEMKRLREVLIPKWKELGLIDEVIVTQSNLDDSRQIQQIRQLADQGVDAIMVCCSNPTALNQSVKYAYDRGIPTFSATGYLTSRYSVNSSANFVVGGHMLGEWMAQEIGEEGKVLVVEGIPGASASDSQDLGIRMALEDYADVEIAGTVAGMWTDQVAQSEIQRWLATHPGKLGGIIIQSASELGALRALQQSGRDMIPITIGGEKGALCYWRKNPDYVSAAIHAWPPGADFEMAWNIMMRTLQGQGPKIESILTKPVKMDFERLKTVIDEDCSVSSKAWYNVPMEEWAGKEYLDQFFARPADPEQYDPESH